MAEDIITRFDTAVVTIREEQADVNNVHIHETGDGEIIYLIEAGPQGKQGPPSTSTITDPFYLISTGYYYTTSSLAFLGTISSSILPETSSADASTSLTIGNQTSRWASLYLATGSSIVFGNSGTNFISLLSGKSGLTIGSLNLMTASVGFDDTPIIIRGSGNTVNIRYTGSMNLSAVGTTSPITVHSGSYMAVQVNQDGILQIGDINYMNAAVSGGIIYDGNDFYFGI